MKTEMEGKDEVREAEKIPRPENLEAGENKGRRI